MQFRSILFLSLFGTIGFHTAGKAQTPIQMPGKDTAKVEGEDGADLMGMIDDEASKPKKEYTTATFKTTRIANGHSIENTGKGVLDFRISHRFGLINEGAKNFFGLDNATTRIGFDYGITSWLEIGVGRATYRKEYDGFLKVKLLRQTESGTMPVSLSYVGAVSVQADEKPASIPDDKDYYFSNRVAYMNQLLLARKFTPWLSLQLMPTHIHYNLVNLNTDHNDLIAIGIGGRLKLSNRISLTGEYYYVPEGSRQHQQTDPTKYARNSLTLGIDIETGGHVFQLLFSNSTAITERNIVGQTEGDWGHGDIHFGFNISRVFTIVKAKEFKNTRNKIW